jgi:hypothetical protein
VNIKKMEDEKTKKDLEAENLNKKMIALEAQFKDKSEKLALRTAELKKQEETIHQYEGEKNTLL